MLCCHHVSDGAYKRLAPLAFGTYRVDWLDNGTQVSETLVCDACARRHGLSTQQVIGGDWIEDDTRFPCVAPVCMHCLAEWASPAA